MSGRHSPIFPTAAARWTTAFDFSGIDPCPEMPCATSSMPRGIFSSVWISAYVTLPRSRAVDPPSARQYSASMSPKCCDAMNWTPTRELPSSPDSNSTTTSRSSDAFSRFRVRIVISAAVALSLSSTVPRPYT